MYLQPDEPIEKAKEKTHRMTEVCNVYYCLFDEFIDEQAMSAMFGWLSPIEKHCIVSLRHEKVRHSQLISRALLRFVLTQHHAVPPFTWRFGVLPNGKPVIANPITSPSLNFNISHTDRILAIAIARGLPTGIDIENTHNPALEIDTVESFFSPGELDFLEKTNESDQQKALFQIWTAKEAFTKCIGTGLSMALNTFTIKISEKNQLPYLEFCEYDPDIKDDFIFDTYEPTEKEIITVCLRRKDLKHRRYFVYNRISRRDINALCTY